MVERVTASLNTYRALPKVEFHRHLEGSLRLDTMVEIARQHGITLPADVLRLSTLVQVQEEDKFTFQNFLSKFNTLRLFYRSPDAIHRITREAVEDAAKDNVRYLELRFTPVALSRAERFPLHDVMQWVITSPRQAGLHITIHAGEWGGAKNVREAIEDLGAERIGHGVRVLEDAYTSALAKERGTVFEVC